MRPRLVAITTPRPDPKPTGSVTFVAPTTAAPIETLGKNVAAIGRSLAGQTTDAAIKRAKERLRAYAASLFAQAERL